MTTIRLRDWLILALINATGTAIGAMLAKGQMG